MKPFFYFILGAALMATGQAIAQMSVWQDNQGHSGTIYTAPQQPQPNWMGPAQGMGQQLDSILRSQRNPC